MGLLVALLILLPVAAGLLAFMAFSPRMRITLVFALAGALAVSSLLLLSQDTWPARLVPPPAADWAVLALSYALLAAFLGIGVWDMRRNGPSLHNTLAVAFTLAAGVPLAVFEFAQAPHLPMEIDPALYVDRLAVVVALIVSIVGSLVCVYALRYMNDHEAHRIHQGELKRTAQPRFFFFLLAFLGVMNGLVFANNLLWLAFFWEATTLCCWGLIRHDGTSIARTNALRALWMCLLGSTGFSLAILFAWHSKLNSISLIELINAGGVAYPALLVPLALLGLAGFTKSAQVPFQGWLLGAMVAPTPVSALLHSSTMVNAGVYLLLRLAPAFQGTGLSTLIAVYGAGVFLVTALLAISQSESKKVLAYSTIGNLGLMVMCAGIGTPLAIACGILLMVFHAVSKGLLFMAVGAIEHHIWSRDIEDMEGIIQKQPVLAGIAILGMFSMLVAPFGVLIAKWGALQAVSTEGAWSALVLVMLMAGSGATTVFWAKWVGRFLCHAPGPQPARDEHFIPLYHGVLLALLGGAVAIGLLVAPFYDGLVAPALADAGYNAAQAFTTSAWLLRSPAGAFPVWPVFLVVLLAVVAAVVTARSRAQEETTAYMCGENVQGTGEEFVSVADANTRLRTGGLYLEGALGEGRLNRLVVPAGGLFLAAAFALVAVWAWAG